MGTREIQRYYRGYDEWGRLARDPYHQLEFETTMQFLRKYLPRRGRILDAGGGPGRYALTLARGGYIVELLDLVPEHLERARSEVKRARLGSRVQGFVEGSIVDLARYPTGRFDAVLCLGAPLGHVTEPHRRRRALRELSRVAKRRAPVFVSVIGRSAVLVNAMVERPGEWQFHPWVYREILRSGDYHGRTGFAPCHFFTVEELADEVRRAGLQVLTSVGLEGLASTHRREVNAFAHNHPQAWNLWKRAHLETCEWPAVVSTSEHFLLVARKP